MVELTSEGLNMLAEEKSITTSFFLRNFSNSTIFSFDNELSLEILKVIGLIPPKLSSKNFISS